MYEAFLVITSAALLGVFIGLVVASLVTNQFYMFLELPFNLTLPYIMVCILLLTAFVTTYFAVYYPVK